MASKWRLVFQCLWFLLVRCRAIYATDEVGETCEDPGSLLCAPKRLLPSGSCYSAVVLAWERNWHLRPRQRRHLLHSLRFCWLLLLSGDIETNPGPVRYPCTMCGKPVKSNQRGIECSRCEKWTHAKCCGVSPEEYLRLGECEDELWYCPSCWTSELPFFNCSTMSEMSETAGTPFGTPHDTLGEPEEAGSGESFSGCVSGRLAVFI